MGEVTRGAFLTAAAAGATGVGVGFLAEKFGPPGPEPEQAPLIVPRVSGPLARTPDHRMWIEAAGVDVPVLAQQLVAPMLAEASLETVAVSALANDTELGVHMRFACDHPSDLPGLAGFGDAIAVQVPLGPGVPPVAMGGAGQPVHIIRWSAVWQRDIDRGRSGVATIYPNVVRDVSPDSVLPPRTARLYTAGRAVGNPMSARSRTSALEEAVAEGIESLTPHPAPTVQGSGVHRRDHWNVVMVMPLDRRPLGDDLSQRPAIPLACAVWIGEAGNRGSRKHYTNWLELRLS